MHGLSRRQTFAHAVNSRRILQPARRTARAVSAVGRLQGNEA